MKLFIKTCRYTFEINITVYGHHLYEPMQTTKISIASPFKLDWNYFKTTAYGMFLKDLDENVYEIFLFFLCDI